MDDMKQIEHGDILSIGIARCGKIQIEYRDVMADDFGGSSFLLLDKKDCDLIHKLNQGGNNGT